MSSNALLEEAFLATRFPADRTNAPDNDLDAFNRAMKIVQGVRRMWIGCNRLLFRRRRPEGLIDKRIPAFDGGWRRGVVAKTAVLVRSKTKQLAFRAASLCALLSSLPACKSGDAPRDGAVQQGKPTAQPVAAATPGVAVAAHAPEGPGKTEVEWPKAIEWRSWEEALAKARAESKPIMVVVYADWCPKCRSLAPVLGDPEIVALSKKMVVVHQNHDEEPAWLEPFTQKFGGYVPRIFFFNPNGKIREDVTSGHPRYPYFYAAQQIEFLRRSMRQAIGT